MAKANKIDLRKVPKELRALRTESTLPETFERMLEQAAFTLDLLHKKYGIDFAIHSPEHNIKLGTVELDFGGEESKPSRKRAADQPWGATTAYIRGFAGEMQPDDLVQIPIGSYEIGRLQSATAAWATQTWGKGSYTCVTSRDKQFIEIWRLPTVGIRGMLPSLRGGDTRSEEAREAAAAAVAAVETDD